MIELYTAGTPNGWKVSMTLEEMEIPYVVKLVDLVKGEQRTPEFLKISPNGRIPAIIDTDTGVSIFESGAIMMYLAEKEGKLLPKDFKKRTKVIEWLMWQKAGIGPMLGQAHHFLHYNKGKAPYAEERYKKEALRLYGVLEKQLSVSEFVVGEYSIADIAIWPWISRYEWQEINLSEFPNIRLWYQKILSRDAVQKGYHIPNFVSEIPTG